MLLEKFKKTAAIYSEKVAIISEDKNITYGALARSAQACANELARLDDPRATLGLYVRDPIDFVIAYLAAAGARKRIVLLDPRLKEPDLRSLILAGEVTHLLYASGEMTPNTPAGSIVDPGQREDLADGLRFAPILPEFRSSEFHYADDDFMVHSSSGSMGKPKAIVCTQDAIWHRIQSWIKTVDMQPSDATLCTLTLSHCHGIDMLMLPGLFHGSLVVAPDIERISPRRIVHLFTTHRITIFSSLPYMYELMLASVPKEKMKLDTLRYIISASAPLASATAIRFQETYGRWINQAYGLSEIGCILLAKCGSAVGQVGTFVAAVEGEVVAGAGENIGELVVTGPGMARGYLNSPEAQADMFKDGKLWTQDLVSWDGPGYTIKGRKSRFINVGGNKVDPAEVEHALASHPAVQEAVVIAARNPLSGERVAAFVLATEPRPSEQELRSHMATHLGAFKCPSQYVFVDAIPRTGLGKVQVDALRRLIIPNGTEQVGDLVNT